MIDLCTLTIYNENTTLGIAITAVTVGSFLLGSSLLPVKVIFGIFLLISTILMPTAARVGGIAQLLTRYERDPPNLSAAVDMIRIMHMSIQDTFAVCWFFMCWVAMIVVTMDYVTYASENLGLGIGVILLLLPVEFILLVAISYAVPPFVAYLSEVYKEDKKLKTLSSMLGVSLIITGGIEQYIYGTCF